VSAVSAGLSGRCPQISPQKLWIIIAHSATGGRGGHGSPDAAYKAHRALVPKTLFIIGDLFRKRPGAAGLTSGFVPFSDVGAGMTVA